MRAQYKNRLIFLVLTLALLVPTLTLLIPNSVSAAAYSELNAADKARSYTYYRAMAVECMSGIRNEIKADANYDGLKTDPANGYWYGEGDSANPDRKGGWSGEAKFEGDVTPKSTSALGTIGCTEITKTALANYWGGATPAELLKALKYEWNGTDKWVFKGDGSKKSQYLKDFLTSKGVSMEYTPAVEYFVNYNAFINKNFCAAKDNGVYGGLSDSMKSRYGTYNTGYNPFEDNVYKKLTISGAAGTEEHGYTYALTDGKRADSAYLLYTDNYKTCDDMAANITKTASAYFDAVATDTCKAKGYAGVILNACKDGMKNSATERAPIYCNKYTDASQKAACEVGIGLQAEVISASANNTDDSGADGEGRSSSCVVEGVGWIVCPITNFLAVIADASFGVIKNFLVLNVQLFNTSSGTYIAWSSFRNIANVAFVIMFLFIIFSQLTGQGITNYGVKKTLPRLVIAAVLVNISFFVCQLAVDISQVAGVGIREILKSVPVGSGDVTAPSWGELFGNILMGAGLAVAAAGAVVGGAAVLGLSISLPVLLAALLAILMTLLILIGRQAGIVILIVLSPLAFVAYMLPNTEKWFKRWYQIFFTLLMVFPIVALLYGGGELASKIISSVAASHDTPADMKFFLGITAMAVAAIPLIMTPTILKGAMNGLGSIGTKLSGFASKANSKVGNAANTNSRFGEAKAGLKNRFALNRANSRVKSGTQKTIDNSRLGRMIGLDKGAARAAKIVDAEDSGEVEAAIAQFGLDPNINSVNKLSKMRTALADAIKAGDTTKARAAQKILLGSGNKGIDMVQSVYSDTSMQSHLADSANAETVGRLRSDLTSAGLKGKNNALATYGYTGDHQSFNSHLGNASTYSSLNPVELAGQSLGNLTNNQGAISTDMANAVLNNSEASALLDGDKLALFRKVAGQAAQQQPTIQVATGAQQVHTAAAAAAQAPTTPGATTAPSSSPNQPFIIPHTSTQQSGTTTPPAANPPTTPPPANGGQPTP